MLERFDDDARRRVVSLATEEVKRRGDQRLGTEHLLLALLHGPDSPAARTLGVDMESARAAMDALDRDALAAVGIDVTSVGPPVAVRTRRRPSLTSGARTALKRAVDEARATEAHPVQAQHLLLGVLGCERPDPAAELLAAVGIDPAEVRGRIKRSGA